MFKKGSSERIDIIKGKLRPTKRQQRNNAREGSSPPSPNKKKSLMDVYDGEDEESNVSLQLAKELSEEDSMMTEDSFYDEGDDDEALEETWDQKCFPEPEYKCCGMVF